MALETVEDYITRARVLLLDEDSANYRYPDADLIEALNLAVLEAARLRPDLFITEMRDGSYPQYEALTEAVDLDARYRLPFVYYIVGHAQLRDDEPTQDQRASAFMSSFTAKLLTTQG